MIVCDLCGGKANNRMVISSVILNINRPPTDLTPDRMLQKDICDGCKAGIIEAFRKEIGSAFKKMKKSSEPQEEPKQE
jgi:hypothetical protein